MVLGIQKANVPLLGKCATVVEKNHFSAVCTRGRNGKRTAHYVAEVDESADVENNASVFSVGKASVKNVKIDNVIIDMQLDSGSERICGLKWVSLFCASPHIA